MTTGIDTTNQDMAQRIGNPVVYNMPAGASYGTGNKTYTAADVVGGIIVHDGTGGATGTLPTAALMVAGLSMFGSGARIGDTVYCLIINGANASGTVTLAAGTGGGFDTNQGGGSRIIAFGSSKTILVRMTNVTAGSEAYVVYS